MQRGFLLTVYFDERNIWKSTAQPLQHIYKSRKSINYATLQTEIK